MLIAYFTQSGNVETFVNNTEFRKIQIKDGSEIVKEKFVLVTRTTGNGIVPPVVNTFLEANKDHLVGVAASGSLRHADTYCFAADVVTKTYNVPTLIKFSDFGNDFDVKTFVQKVKELI